MSESKQTRVVAVVDDMFFASKIREAAKNSDAIVEIIKNSNGLTEVLKTTTPALIIIDLNSPKLRPLELIAELKGLEEHKGIPILGYLPHVEDSLKNEAIEAGCDIVMPRSRFSREISHILNEYGTK